MMRNLNNVDDVQEQIIEDIYKCRTDPYRHAMYAYDWDQGDLEGWAGPKEWQVRQ